MQTRVFIKDRSKIKGVLMNIRVSSEELLALKNISALTGLTTSEFIRRIIRLISQNAELQNVLRNMEATTELDDGRIRTK